MARIVGIRKRPLRIPRCLTCGTQGVRLTAKEWYCPTCYPDFKAKFPNRRARRSVTKR